VFGKNGIQADDKACRLATVGLRSFPVAASIHWHSLPPDIQSSASLADFCHKLKSHTCSTNHSPDIFCNYPHIDFVSVDFVTTLVKNNTLKILIRLIDWTYLGEEVDNVLEHKVVVGRQFFRQDSLHLSNPLLRIQSCSFNTQAHTPLLWLVAYDNASFQLWKTTHQNTLYKGKKGKGITLI